VLLPVVASVRDMKVACFLFSFCTEFINQFYNDSIVLKKGEQFNYIETN
jgi:hypothetical protein